VLVANGLFDLRGFPRRLIFRFRHRIWANSQKTKCESVGLFLCLLDSWLKTECESVLIHTISSVCVLIGLDVVCAC